MNTLARNERIRRGADYERVYARRCSVSDDVLQVCACANELAYARVGLSVSRRWGQATIRNRLRRLFREAFRLTKAELPKGIDLVLIPRRAVVSLEELKESLPALAAQAAKRLQTSGGVHPRRAAAKPGGDQPRRS